MTVSMPASASHLRVLNAVSGLQRAAWSLFARVDSFGATLPLPSRLSVLSSASCVRIVDTAVTAHQDSLAQQALGLDRHFPSPAHSLAILPGGGAGSGASLRKLPVVLKEHHSPSFNPHALGAWVGAGGSSLLQAGGWRSGRSSSTLANSRATCSASASASANNRGILSSCHVSTFTSGIARGYATAAATAEEPKAPGPKASNTHAASAAPAHTARPAVTAPAPAPAPAPVSAAAAVAPEPLSVTEFARHPPTGSYTITLRCYSLPPLAAPRPPAEQRVLEAALAVVRRWVWVAWACAWRQVGAVESATMANCGMGSMGGMGVGCTGWHGRGVHGVAWAWGAWGGMGVGCMGWHGRGVHGVARVAACWDESVWAVRYFGWLGMGGVAWVAGGRGPGGGGESVCWGWCGTVWVDDSRLGQDGRRCAVCRPGLGMLY